MERRLCEVKECGATVVILRVDGRPLAVDPMEVELVIAAEAGDYRLVRGFRPHRATCVDARNRPRRTGVGEG